MPTNPASAPPIASTDTDRLRGRVMSHALGRLLDRVRGAREVLPHLAALERGLFDGGLAVIDSASRPVLAKLCAQLGSLPVADDDTALHELLTRLMDAMEGKAQAPVKPRPQARPVLPDRDDRPFDIEATVVIEEVSHSDFIKIALGDPPKQRDER